MTVADSSLTARGQLWQTRTPFFTRRGRNQLTLPSLTTAGARSASIVSNGGTPRRSSRASIVPPPYTAPTNPPRAKRGRSVSVAPSLAESDEGSDTSSAPKRRKAVPRAPKAPRVPKPKVRRAPIAGLNPIPTLFATREFGFEVPQIPAQTEKPRTAFVFGNGDFGQHGMGVGDNVLCEIKRPRLHKWFEEKIKEGGAWAGGIAGLECGGMHTLCIDGEGKVSADFGRRRSREADSRVWIGLVVGVRRFLAREGEDLTTAPAVSTTTPR